LQAGTRERPAASSIPNVKDWHVHNITHFGGIRFKGFGPETTANAPVSEKTLQIGFVVDAAVKPCPHWRLVADFGDYSRRKRRQIRRQSTNSVTVAVLTVAVGDYSRQCEQGLRIKLCGLAIFHR